MPIKRYESEIKAYALTKQVEEVKKKQELFARQSKIVAQFEKYDGLIAGLTQRVNSDFPTFNQVNSKIRDLNQALTMDLLPKSQYKEQRAHYEARFEALTDLT